MSHFKVKKITPVSKSETDISTPTNPKTKIYLRYFVGFLLIIASAIFVWNFGIQAIGHIQLANKETNFIPLVFSGGNTVQPKKTINILIAGIGGKGHDGGDLTDSLMLASVNEEKGYVTLLSIPRDLYVAYPGKNGGAGRINTLYGMGKSENQGINYLASKVSEITGQSINHYLVVDFRGFQKIIDVLDGVDVDVPHDLIDRMYPVDGEDRYTTLIIRMGLQHFDGSTALKYARSRHSTSDFDRSERQQLIIKAIKEKALSAGFLTNPGKIQELYNAVIANIDTDLSLGDMAKLGLMMKDIQSSNINVFGLNNECSGNICNPGAYLYNPSREYFGGAAGLLPENATPKKMSYYNDIHVFSNFIFQFPTLKNESIPLVIVTRKDNKNKAQSLWKSLQKIGFKSISHDVIFETTGSIEQSHINVYWNSEGKIGFDKNHAIIEALKNIEETIPYNFVTKNEYITNDGPKIEIVLGEDIGSYFTFARPAYYLPNITPILSGETHTGSFNNGNNSVISGEFGVKKQPTKIIQNIITPASRKTSNTTRNYRNTGEFGVNPGEWENF